MSKVWICKRGLVAAAALAVIGAVAGTTQAANSRADAERVVQQALDDVARDFAAGGHGRGGMAGERLSTHFDFEYFSRLVLRNRWAELTPRDREEFMAEMRRILVDTYSQRLVRYQNEKFSVVPAADSGNDQPIVRVLVKIAGGAHDGARIDFVMRAVGERWLAIDVVMEGVGVMQLYREQVDSFLADHEGSFAALLARLKEIAALSQSSRL